MSSGRTLGRIVNQATYFDRRRHQVLDRMIRVNHAGELGADRIYCGQNYILRDSDTARAESVQRMWDQEKKHLEELEYMNLKYRTTKSVLEPFWSAGGFLLGSVSALISPQTAMACTVAVERVITNHYNDQIRTLIAEDDMKDPDTRDVLEKFSKFRDDEQEHHDEGLKQDAQSAPQYDMFTKAVDLICNVSIQIAKRV